MIKRIIPTVLLLLTLCGSASAQIYAKVNALYALVGVVNLQAEGVIAPHSSLVIDATYSPWKSIGGKHANFGIFQGEYRYYFRQAAKGWYLSANAGMMGFDINKPKFFDGALIRFKDNYSKGFGLMFGVGAGYQHTFAQRWVVDVFIAFDFLRSWYNGYNSDGSVIMNPYGHEEYTHPDPFNGSSEFMPIKGGVSIGYRLFSPKWFSLLERLCHKNGPV